MSGFPPPPPPNANPYDRNAWKSQRRVLQQQQKAFAAQQRTQAKLQRAQLRAQARAGRRGSLVGPLLIVAVGVVCLLTQTGTLSWAHVAVWYTHWWPAVMILAGVLLLAEWAIGRSRQEEGLPYSGPVLGGGVVLLLVLLAFFGWALRYAERGSQWRQHFDTAGWDKLSGELHEFDDSLSNPIAAGQPLIIRCPHGNVTVTGSSDDNLVHVDVHKQVYAWKNDDAEARQQQLEPKFSSTGGQLVLEVPALNASQADLTIELPHDHAVTIEATRGDVSVSEVHAPVTLTANHGDIDLNGIAGPVNIRVSYDDGSIAAHSITGALNIDGRAGDINLSDINGAVSLQGDFFSGTQIERVTGPVRFQTSRTHFEAARLDGDFEIEAGGELNATQLAGPVKITTSNRNITLDRVSGQVQINNRNGAVNVTNAPPMGGVQIVNQHGSVDLGLPSGASFTLAAQTRHGELENDFGLDPTGGDEQPAIKGTIGGGGPVVSVSTTDGDVTIRKSSVAALPPNPPSAPKITAVPVPTPKVAPVPPVAPAAPQAPKIAAPKVSVPRHPATPPAPATPAAPAKPATPATPK